MIRRILAARSTVDWRGWISLAWVIVWGAAYVIMVLQARGPQIDHGIKLLTGH